MPLRTKVCHTVNENNILIKVLVDFLDGKKKKQLTVTYELLQCRVFISVKLIKSLTGRYRQSKCTAFNRKGLCGFSES